MIQWCFIFDIKGYSHWLFTDSTGLTHGSLLTLQGIAIDACGRYKV